MVRNRAFSTGILVFAILFLIFPVRAQYNRKLPANVCALQSDTSQCFEPAAKTEITVDRDVRSLNTLYRLCQELDTVYNQVKPLQVILALDFSGSMCDRGNNCAYGCNDTGDVRILAAHL
ncbi:MAG: hypothetical protein GF418_10155, partial [Chitinivibrionales bacterium]|nr:hypothetical protein [Chitinivibrionales bacterium]MBD3395975.1 hypothetical protein [Chitinivibrionales bacterium]